MKRALRIALVVFGVLGFTAFFSFSTFFFSPFESDYAADVSTLVPRDVDVFVARADLIDDFDDNLELRRASDLEKGPWGRLAKEAALADLRGRYDAVRQQVKEQLAQLPVSAHPLSIIGGTDLALAAYFDRPVPGGVEWAVYGRGNWMAKLAFSALEHPGWFGLTDRGFVTSSDGEVVTLEGGQLTQPLHFSRVNDVLVVSNARGLPAQARELERNRAENSFGMSARYNDQVIARTDKDDVEIFVRSKKLPELLGLTSAFPDPASPDFLEALLGHFLQLGAISEFAGTLGLEDDFVSLSLDGKWNTEVLSADQRRAYRRKASDQRDVARRIGSLATADSGAVLYFETDIGDLLRAAVKSSERALIDNLETEIIQPIFGYATVDPLISDIEAAFRDRVAIVVRPNIYAKSGEGDPPNDGRVTLLWAIALWIEEPKQLYDPDPAKLGILERLEDQRNAARLGLKGARPEEAGIYRNKVSGWEVTEYFMPLVPGTGHIATGAAQEIFVITNHARMIGDIGKAAAGSSDVPSLSSRPEFGAMMDSALTSVSALLWLDPAPLRTSLIELARQAARDDVFQTIDWDIERPRIERRVLADQFPGEIWGRLSSPEVEARVEEIVEQEVRTFREKWSAEKLPELIREREARLGYLDDIERGLFQVKLDGEDFQIDARLALRRPQ